MAGGVDNVSTAYNPTLPIATYSINNNGPNDNGYHSTPFVVYAFHEALGCLIREECYYS